jgi:hypothetical protein
MSTPDLGIYLPLLAIVGILAVLWLLHVLLAREWVKTDIIDRGLMPVSIRWKPFSWWVVCGPAFRVTYSDVTGAIYHAECGLPNWLKPVRWRK